MPDVYAMIATADETVQERLAEVLELRHPSSVFIAQARRLSEGIDNLSLRVGDGRALDLPDDSFDAVVLHTVLCHIPGPGRVLAETFRVARDGGRLAVFDGDYATTTVAGHDNDPLPSRGR